MKMNPDVKILLGDCVEQMRTLPDASVHLIVTSPPYDNLRNYGSKLTWDFEGLAQELYRVLVPGGVVCWNVNDQTIDGSESLTSCEQKIYFRKKCGFNIHDTMIYEKSNGSKPNPRRYNQCFEYVFVLSKGIPATVNLITDKPNVTAGKSVFGKHTMREADGSMSTRKNRIIAKEYGVRSNVWRGNTRGQEDVCQPLPHPAMMPRWLAHDLILSFSNVGDTVLDPMAGSGTVGQKARQLGRNVILIDNNPKYVPLMEAACNVTPGLGI
jgi:DNA modification methylase